MADGAGDIAHRYLHGPAVDQVLADEQPDLSDSDPERVRWLLGDHLGSIRDVAETGGDSVDHMTYETFGTPDGLPGDVQFGFTGREWDGDAGLYYYRARWYDSATGNFVTEDPLGFGGSDVNLTRYADNAATLHSDPSGFITLSIGGSLDCSVLIVHFGAQLDANFGYSAQNGFTVNLTVTTSAGPGLGL